MSYVVLTFLITAIVTLLVVIFDYNQNIKFRNSILFLIHEDTLSTFLSINQSFKEKYPHFFNIVSSFEGANIRKTIDNPTILKKISGKKLLPIKQEMKQIIENGSDYDKTILGWYFITSDLLDEAYSKHKLIREEKINREILEEKRKATKVSDIERLDIGMCFS